jgi:hypothetical protein
MTSATAEPASAGGRYADGRGHGLIRFTTVLLVVIGCFNVIDGIAAIARSRIFAINAHYVFGDLRAWGWVTLILGALLLLVAGWVFAGNQLARWFAVAVVGLDAIAQMCFIPSYPFWSLMIIAVDIVALWGLCAYDTRETRGAAWAEARPPGKGPMSSRAGTR